MATLFNSNGSKVQLGKKIGGGGEGNVYKIISTDKTAAKIWHEKKPKKKQNKITIMAESSSDSLRKVTAWPLDTLHKTKGGDVIGFIMPDITGYNKLHDFYNPSNRKKKHPNIDWEFLISICRNIAASFATIHAKNHVIGDVNPGLIFVSNKTVTKFVDCDSFQIIHNKITYPCRVGVQNFTPPELQKTKDFSKVLRTKNHDNFGLALLIFHILMMGRHPFSGVYSGNSDMELRVSIQKYLYAYSSNTSTRLKIKPPPKSISVDMLPNEIQSFFEKAFSQSGSLFNRPTAKEWIKALDRFRSQLKKCRSISTHKYYNKLTSCPWCLLENKGVTYFYKKSFNINKYWDGAQSAISLKITKINFNQEFNKIKSLASPGPTKITFPSLFKPCKEKPFNLTILNTYKEIIPKQLKTQMPGQLFFSADEKKILKKRKGRKFQSIFLFLTTIAPSYYFSLNIKAQVTQILLVVLAFILFSYKSSKDKKIDKKKKEHTNQKKQATVELLIQNKQIKSEIVGRINSTRLPILSTIKSAELKLNKGISSNKNNLKNLKNQWESNFNDTSFNTTQKNLTSSYKKYKNIKLDYNAELHTINIKAKDDQFNYYMQSTYINDWKIKGIGPKKKRGLYIHGIQVASDISSWAVDRVPGFGEKHTQTMLDWKYQMENLFVFSPNNAITLSQYKRLKNKYLKLKLGLERKIINESDKLEQINKQRLQKNDKLTDSINKLMHKLAQDGINLEEFKRKYINI